MKLWQKGTSLNKQIEAFTVGNDHLLDLHLVKYDCLASAAHTEMLGKIGVLTSEEVKALCESLADISELAEAGEFEIRQQDEDCHTAIENYLVKNIGEAGKKIHTARSRNDQVLVALRLFCKDAINDCAAATQNVIQALNKISDTFGSVKFAGFTHTRKAMPTTVGIWANAFIESMQDNLSLTQCLNC